MTKLGVVRSEGDATTSVVCPHCAYDLHGLKDARCPECGRAFDLDELLRRPGIRVLRWLRAASWPMRALCVLRIMRRPASALGRDSTLDVDFAPLAPELVGWAVFWHLVVALSHRLLDASVGILIGTWTVYSAKGIARLGFYSVSSLAFNLTLLGVLVVACSVTIARRSSTRFFRRSTVDLMAFLFSVTVMGEALRRILYLAICGSLFATAGVYYDLWPALGAASYPLIALVVWGTFKGKCGGRSATLLVALILPALAIWVLEMPAFGYWAIAEQQLASLLGVG